jgi:hypothetical protein
MTYTPEFDESQRQIILLALFKLKAERPGWDMAIGEIEVKLGGQLDFPPESAHPLRDFWAPEQPA